MARRIPGRLSSLPILAALALTGCGGKSPTGIPWIPSIPRALDQAKASGKPVLLHFWGPG